MSEKGAICAIVDINFEEAMQVQQQLKTRSSSHECDVGNTSSIERVVKEIISTYGKIDILVNCAGIAEMDYATDVTGTFLFLINIIIVIIYHNAIITRK